MNIINNLYLKLIKEIDNEFIKKDAVFKETYHYLEDFNNYRVKYEIDLFNKRYTRNGIPCTTIEIPLDILLDIYQKIHL